VTHTVRFKNHSIQVEDGERLRNALLAADLSPHNGNAQLLNCKGFATCGTCAVEISGPVEPAEPSGRERFRLGVYPHNKDGGLRLACQCRVKGDLDVTKHEGFWGEKVAR